MRDLLLFLHILSASAWLGAALWLSGDVRRTLAAGRPCVDQLPARARPALALDLGAGLATVVTGIVLLLAEGITRPRVGLSVGMVLAFARLGVVALGLRPAWARVDAAITGGGDLAAAAPAARRLAMLSGIAHTLWLLALAGMVFPV